MSRFCAVSDALRTTLDARWRKRGLTYCVMAYVLDPPAQDREIAAAWALWTAAADFTVQQVPKEQAAVADILIGAGRGPRSNFDGPGGTLAWAELPPGNDQQLVMRFDGDERWSADFLRVVAAHEIGHLLGLDHDTAQAVALMDPVYNPRVDRPQPADITRIQMLYGPARAPTPPPEPPAGAAGWVTRLYTDLLGRAPDAGELAAWVARAADRTAVARGILASSEQHRRVVSGWYERLLRRAADPAGLANFARALDAGMGYETALAVMLASAEYFGRQTGASIGLNPAGPAPAPGGFVDEIIQSVANQLIDQAQKVAADIAAGTGPRWDDWLVAGANRFIDQHQAKFVAAFATKLKELLGGYLAGQMTLEQLQAELKVA